MEKRLKFIMVRPVHSNGYTLIECLTVLFIMSVFSILFYPALKTDFSLQQFYLFKSDLIYLQSECMAYQSEGTLKTDLYSLVYDYDIRFNDLGHVNMAQTIRFTQKEGVVELGNGVFIER